MRRFAVARAAVVAVVAPLLASLASAAPCPRATGDVAPGSLAFGSGVPVFTPTGDGRVDVSDAVATLREAVGLQATTPLLGDAGCASLPSDLAPGELDASTTPPTWLPRGDGIVDVADVLVQLRASTGVLRLPPLPDRIDGRLEPPAACDDLAARLRQRLHDQFDATGSWGWPWWAGGPVAGTDADGDGMADAPTAGAEGASSQSSTNVQEAGVDEMDLVDTDGSILVALAGTRLRVVRAWPADDLAVLSTVDIEGMPRGLFLDGDRVVVVSEAAGAPGPLAWGFADAGGAWGLGKITVVDVADPANPRLLRELYVEGWVHSARMIEGRLVLVGYHVLPGPAYPPWTGDDAAWRAAVHAAIDAASLEDLLPEVLDVRHDGGTATTERRLALDCGAVAFPAVPDHPGLVSVLELDPVLAERRASAAVMSGVSAVHVGRRRLVLTTEEWSPASWDASTRLHSFVLGGPLGRPRYLGTGVVPGSVRTTWCLDDEGEQIRVASSTTWTAGGEWRPATGLFVLRSNGTGDLVVAGSVTDIAPGEALQGARFVKDRGYLVTFERVDPLFVLDLSNPTRPAILGELEVSGWSSYLHPLPDLRLIGLGREVDPASQRDLGMQLSLFDVSQPATPTLTDRHVEPLPFGSSEAEFDHHAFTWHEPLRTLAIPSATWLPSADPLLEPYGTWSSRLLLYRIDSATGVTPAGAVDLPFGCASARRSVFLDEFVLAVSEAGVVAARVDAPSTPVDAVSFDDHPGCTPPGGVDLDGDGIPDGG